MYIDDINRREIEGALFRGPDRIGPYAKVQMIEVPDDKAPESMSPAEEQQVRMKEGNQLVFVICGLLELPSELPHQLMRLVLVGQVYRVMRINRGEPYHK
jgi:23S rRNA (pseudouridine1915-N3)-methyltransferase